MLFNKLTERVTYLTRFILGFLTYGMGCAALIAALPFIYLYCGGSLPQYQSQVRAICSFGFRQVVRGLRFIGFIDIKCFDFRQETTSPLFVGNHISMFDIVAVLAFLPECRTFVHRKFFYHPLLYPIIVSCGHIPVNPNDHSDRFRATVRAFQILLRGQPFVIFPEGTRSRDGVLGEFHQGAFSLAAKLNTGYHPIIFSTSKPIFNKGSRFRWTRDVIHFRMEIFDARFAPDQPKMSKEELQNWTKTERRYFIEMQTRLGRSCPDSREEARYVTCTPTH